MQILGLCKSYHQPFKHPQSFFRNSNNPLTTYEGNNELDSKIIKPRLCIVWKLIHLSCPNSIQDRQWRNRTDHDLSLGRILLTHRVLTLCNRQSIRLQRAISIKDLLIQAEPCVYDSKKLNSNTKII